MYVCCDLYVGPASTDQGQGAAKQELNYANILGAKQHFFRVSTDRGAPPAEGR